MSDGAIAPDPIVRTALELLPVPEHDPGFWAELDALLAVEPPRQVDEPALAVGPTFTASDVPVASGAAAVATEAGAVRPPQERALVEPAPDLALRFVPPSLRRRSTVVLLVVAVAAAALVAVSGVLLVRHRVENGLGTGAAVAVPRRAGMPTVASPDGSGSAAESVLFEAA